MSLAKLPLKDALTSWSLRPAAPETICSSSPAVPASLPLPVNKKLRGTVSVAVNIPCCARRNDQKGH